MELDNLIFDRTQGDVDRAAYLSRLWVSGTFTGTTAELAEWATDLKGAYNASDLNRVIAAMDYLNDYFLGLGYDVGYTKIRVPHQQGGGGGILPSGYTQLEYIQSSGTQYIDTGFKPNQDTRVLCKFQLLQDNGAHQVIFGSRTTGSSGQFVFGFAGHTTKTFRSDYGSSQANFPTGMTFSNVYEVDKNKNNCSMDGKTANSSTSSFSVQYNMYIFANHTSGKLDNLSIMRLYSCKIYDNGVLIRYFYPCKNPAGTVGLYDIINNQFYSNAGSGTFVAGPEAEPAQPSKDLYTWYEDDIPTQNEMSIYIENVQRLRDKIPYPPGTPDTPSDMDLLTYQEANDIEKILYTLERVLIAMENGFLLRQANTLFMIAGGVFNNA